VLKVVLDRLCGSVLYTMDADTLVLRISVVLEISRRDRKADKVLFRSLALSRSSLHTHSPIE
jgi:hypothetical protein